MAVDADVVSEADEGDGMIIDDERLSEDCEDVLRVKDFLEYSNEDQDMLADDLLSAVEVVLDVADLGSDKDVERLIEEDSAIEIVGDIVVEDIVSLNDFASELLEGWETRLGDASVFGDADKVLCEDEDLMSRLVDMVDGRLNDDSVLEDREN